ncbi:Dioxygenase [Candidatus Magnetomoraceae bacterium gMMP-15]
MKIRDAAFAGTWYPGDEKTCIKEIEEYIKNNLEPSSTEVKRIGGIVPHAGWFFSGQIACNVISCLKGEKDPDAFVLYGMHLAPNSPDFIMTEGAWETPLGNLEIEEELAQKLANRFHFQIESPLNARQDNTIELQLPFIKYHFPNTKIVPIGVPPTKTSLRIGRAVAEFSKSLGLNIKVLGSTDLTHYGANYGFLSKGTGKEALDWVRYENDRRIVELMLEMNPTGIINEALTNHNACCSGAAATAIETGKKLGAKEAESLIYATSYDKSPGDSFVGYVGIVF